MGILIGHAITTFRVLTFTSLTMGFPFWADALIGNICSCLMKLQIVNTIRRKIKKYDK